LADGAGELDRRAALHLIHAVQAAQSQRRARFESRQSAALLF
jgi:hypothetical protein